MNIDSDGLNNYQRTAKKAAETYRKNTKYCDSKRPQVIQVYKNNGNYKFKG